MDMKAQGKTKTIGLILLMVAVCALSIFIYLLGYSYDNKYTVQGPKAQSGVLALNEQALEDNPILFLVDGWEYYDGKLLTPTDFMLNPPAPDKYIYIGQYGGFEAGNSNASPHGSATYRLNIKLPDEPMDYMLELPEIFSSYRAYIDGRQVMQMGDPDPDGYRAETGNRAIHITAGGNIEILIAASDFSHLYSGMTYPPAFGTPDAISSLLSARLVFRSTLCVAALTIGLLSILIGLLSRNRFLTVIYGLLCLCFVGYISWPIMQTFTNVFQPLYALENLSFCAMLVLAMLLQRRLCNMKDKWSRYFILFGLIICVLSIVLPAFSWGSSYNLMMGYSTLISVYQWVAAAFLTFTSIRAVITGTVHSKALLCGILVFVCALVMDRILPLFEPILFGWFIELASFALVLCIGIVTGLEVATQLRDNAILKERASSMERLSEMQQGYFLVLRQEMDETKAMRHDMHHHFVLIDGFLKSKQYDELSAYVEEYQDAIGTNEPEFYSKNSVVNILARHYEMLSERNRIRFDVRCDVKEDIQISDADLCVVLSNLLENALEACVRIKTGRRFIRLGLTNMGDDLVIRVENSMDGKVQQKGKTFLSSKETDRTGYGLASVRSIAFRHGGTTTFSWDKQNHTFLSVVVL